MTYLLFMLLLITLCLERNSDYSRASNGWAVKPVQGHKSPINASAIGALGSK